MTRLTSSTDISVAPSDDSDTHGLHRSNQHDSTALDARNTNDSHHHNNNNMSCVPPVEELESLILEAYNNMQSDGEFIFLPEEVAQKLHHVAQLVRLFIVSCRY